MYDWPNSSGCTAALGSTEALAETSARAISKCKDERCACQIYVLIVYKFLESQPSAAIAARTGLYRDCFNIDLSDAAVKFGRAVLPQEATTVFCASFLILYAY
jgi:hypothetical protein